jgi:DNA repair protein SbcC/Rad50
MRIKEFFIKRYGPLQEMSYTLSNPFNLIVGKNEDGKTLTIDALVKLLLGRNVRDFGRTIDRVEESPEGFVVIEGDDGGEIKLPEQGDLTTVAAVTASECRNIFIIRDSDLSIARESEFYTTVTNRLTGLRTEEILKTKEALREIGKITPSGMFRDIKDESVKTRVEGAKNLLGAVEGLAHEMNEVRFDELEEETVSTLEGIENSEREIERLEDARKRDTYVQGAETLNKLTTALKQVAELNVYHEADGQLWRDCERDIQHRTEARDTLAAKLKRNEEELKAIDTALRKKTREFRIFDDRKKHIDEVKAELNLYEMKRSECVQREQRITVYFTMAMIAALLLGISLLGFILKPSLPFYVAAPVFFLSAVFLLIPQLQQVRDKAWLAGAFEKIKVSLAKFESIAENVDQIYVYLQQFDEAHRARGDEIHEITRRKENLEESIAELRNKAIPNEEKRITDAKEKIDHIQRTAGVDSWQDYSKGLKLKQQGEKSLEREKGILQSRFGMKGDTWEHTIAYWNREVKALEAYRDKAKGIDYDEDVVTQLKEAKDASKARLADLHERMAAFRKRLEEIEREANKILQLETEYLHCKTSVDLNAVRDKLFAFITDKEVTRDAVLQVMDIFEEIEAEEQEKVAELFGTESPITHYFTEITDGRYDAVLFNQGSGQIEVRRKDGVILEAQKLSGGAYDQLYLAIRLALGERILQGTKGFFIMDDPFVKADTARLQKQIEVLQRIAQLGWQVLYFSAKDEMKDALKTPIKRGTVNYLEIQGIFL